MGYFEFLFFQWKWNQIPRVGVEAGWGASCIQTAWPRVAEAGGKRTNHVTWIAGVENPRKASH